jgi:Escherichia/Staphylococcus phage prohead protease
MDRYAIGSVSSELGEREIGVIASTSQRARDGHVLVTTGIDLTNYKKNPIVLFQHNADQPIATCSAIGVRDGALAARIQFPPEGISQTADQACALAKTGVLRGVSIGFDPIKCEPLDPRHPYGGQRIVESELLEISLVSIPADTGATVTARALALRSAQLATFRDLRPVPEAGMQRAAARIRNTHATPILSHTMQVWVLQQQERAKEAEFSHENMRAEVARLRTIGERYERETGIPHTTARDADSNTSLTSWGGRTKNSWGSH